MDSKKDKFQKQKYYKSKHEYTHYSDMQTNIKYSKRQRHDKIRSSNYHSNKTENIFDSNKKSSHVKNEDKRSYSNSPETLNNLDSLLIKSEKELDNFDAKQKHNNTLNSYDESNTQNSPKSTSNDKRPISKEDDSNKEGPNFQPTGLLASETSLKSGILLKHTPPADSRKPDKYWRLYMFKQGESEANEINESPKVFYIHRLPTYLFGKESRVADVLLLHPTISKQHAALQFRLRQGLIKPYIMDLDSTNGTYLNGEKLEPCRYYEMREEDSLRFGRSTREFILLHTGSVKVTDINYESFVDSITNP